jgi:hypothetical protein
MGRGSLDITVRGAPEVVAALEQLPQEAKRRLNKKAKELAKILARRIRAAGRADSRQSARAAATVRTRSGGTPGVAAGPHPLLFGSEFGANGRYGFYSADRFRSSVGRQFRPHRGANSYWFFTTAEHDQPEIQQALRETADEIVRNFGHGS